MSTITSRPGRLGAAVRAAVLAVSVSAPALGQSGQERPTDAFIQQQRSIEQKAREERTRAAPLESLLDFQYGGWFDYYLFDSNDGIQSSRLFQRPGLAVWSHLSADGGAHEAFARVRLTYNYFRPGDQYDRQKDWVGPEFDRAWYQIDVGQAFRLTSAADPLQLKVRIGRQEVTLGTGYAFDLPVDAVTFDAKVYDVKVRGVFAKSIGSYPNIDRSASVDSHMNRNFWGFETRYTGLQRHEPFFYAVWNQDHTDERPQDWFQAYSYDTAYLGFGSRGELAHNFNYWAEGVGETGRGYPEGNFERRSVVEAFGWDLGLEYLFDKPMRPRMSLEYMYASGDPQRVYSPTSTQGGNLNDRRDSSFSGFGYRDTGVAAALLLSNVHVWRAGGSCAPLEKIEFLRDLELGTNWFLYNKNQRAGAISDGTADRGSGYVGWEMDYFLNWRISSDLSWTVRWGAFFPGQAFGDRETRNTIFTGLTWSF